MSASLRRVCRTRHRLARFIRTWKTHALNSAEQNHLTLSGPPEIMHLDLHSIQQPRQIQDRHRETVPHLIEPCRMQRLLKIVHGQPLSRLWNTSPDLRALATIFHYRTSRSIANVYPVKIIFFLSKTGECFRYSQRIIINYKLVKRVFSSTYVCNSLIITTCYIDRAKIIHQCKIREITWFLLYCCISLFN